MKPINVTWLTRFWRRRDGVAAMEFALLAPLLLLMGFGAFEVTRYLLVEEKSDKIAYIIADVIAQDTTTTLTLSELNDVMAAATKIMDPFPFGASGYVIVSSVSRTGSTNPMKVAWQYKGGGTMVRPSKVGVVNGTAVLPGNMSIADKENVIVVEVYYMYTPLFAAGYVNALELYRTAIFKPRLGALTTAPT